MSEDIGGLVFTIALIGGGIWLYNHWDDLGIRSVKYDECLLDKMKGQDKAMLDTAEKYCRRAAKVEQYIGSTEPAWSGNHLAITDKVILDKWVVTTGSGAFSTVECSKVTSDDYKSLSFKFTNGTAALPENNEYKCMQRMVYISGYEK